MIRFAFFQKWRLRIFSCHPLHFLPHPFFALRVQFALTEKEVEGSQQCQSNQCQCASFAPRPWPCASARNHDISAFHDWHMFARWPARPPTRRHCQYTARRAPFTLLRSKSDIIRSIRRNEVFRLPVEGFLQSSGWRELRTKGLFPLLPPFALVYLARHRQVKVVGIPLHLPSHRRTPCPRIVLYTLVPMLTVNNVRRTPCPYIVLCILVLMLTISKSRRTPHS